MCYNEGKMLDKEQITQYLLKERVNLTAFISFITRDSHAAEDIFQEVCMKALGQTDKFAEFIDLLRWCRRVAKNSSINFLRKQKRIPLNIDPEFLELLQQEWPNYQQQDGTAVKKALSYCMERLTPRSRAIVRMRYFKGISGARLADEFKITVGSAYSMVSRILRQLRKCVRHKMG